MSQAQRDNSNDSDERGKIRDTIEVRVDFPLGARGGAFETEVSPETTITAVISAAMSHFGLEADANTRFYLLYKREEVDGATTIGDLADHKRQIKLQLTKELIQG